MSETRNIVARILDIIAESQASPDIDLSMRAGKLTLVADLGVHASPAKRTAIVSAIAADVTPEAILAVLERRRAGMNLANLAKLVGVAKKMAVKPLLDSLIADGRVEKATGGKFRLPGRVKRGRKPGSGRKTTVNKPVQPVKAVKPAAALPKKRPAVKSLKKAPELSRPAPGTPPRKLASKSAQPAIPPAKAAHPAKQRPKRKRPSAARKPPTTEIASVPVTTDEPPTLSEAPESTEAPVMDVGQDHPA